MDVRPLRDTLRKCRNRENETPDQWQQRLERDRMSKRIKRASENAQQREKRLSNNRDVQEFATHLPHRPSSLDVLAVHHCSSDVRAFKDFNVLGSSLPENGPLDDQILRLL
uniref:STPR domain-containing protein n=1 Tax=Rhizophagus irregularis (strain DAOM 181602 / DAOM 197198 / MUCL 43194) TaxID=747089 RepID=U9TIU5_RHIID